MNGPVLLEVCVDSIESALAAERGGAHRVELCSSLFEGGVTPSMGLIAIAREMLSIGIHVLVRPRSGDFYYSDEEVRVMQLDISSFKKLGVDGVVLGILGPDGRVDVDRTRQLVDLASPMKVTFSRAFDMSCDLFQSLQDLQAAGVHSVLTSGGKQTAVEGADALRRLVEAGEDRISIMAGGGIEASNVADLIERTCVQGVHASLKFTVPSPMRFQNGEIAMGTAKGREYQRFVVQQDQVQKLLQAASSREGDRDCRLETL